jgi:hypothetical protein
MESIAHFKGRRILGLHFAPVIDACCRNVGMPQPFLDLGDVGFMVKGVGGGGGAERVSVAGSGKRTVISLRHLLRKHRTAD